MISVLGVQCTSPRKHENNLKEIYSLSNKEEQIWVIRGKKTKAKRNNRRKPSLIQRKNENWKKIRRNKCRCCSVTLFEIDLSIFDLNDAAAWDGHFKYVRGKVFNGLHATANGLADTTLQFFFARTWRASGNGALVRNFRFLPIPMLTCGIPIWVPALWLEISHRTLLFPEPGWLQQHTGSLSWIRISPVVIDI